MGTHGPLIDTVERNCDEGTITPQIEDSIAQVQRSLALFIVVLEEIYI